MSSNRHLAHAVLFATTALWAQGCGNDSPTNATSTPAPTPTPPPPPVTRVVAEGAFAGLGRFILAEVPFSTPERGDIAVTVDWTFETDDVDIFLVKGSCTVDEFNNGTCLFETLSTSSTAKPEMLSLSGAEAADYSLYIGNRGPDEEAVSYVVTLTSVPGRQRTIERHRGCCCNGHHGGPLVGHRAVAKRTGGGSRHRHPSLTRPSGLYPGSTPNGCNTVACFAATVEGE